MKSGEKVGKPSFKIQGSKFVNSFERKLARGLPFLVVVMIFLICHIVWISLVSTRNVEFVYSEDNVWNLRGKDFSKKNYRLQGDVGYVSHQLLTPDTYDQFVKEEKFLYHAILDTYATSRMRILVEDDQWYTFSRLSIDFGEKIYVNGGLLTEIGTVGDTPESTEPNTGHVTFTVQGKDGVIEIIQQSANFVHQAGGYHGGWYVGKDQLLQKEAATDFATNLELGCYLTLFLLFLILYFLERTYKATLYFSCFCLAWFFRLGVTGPKVFSVLFPSLDWYTKFRMEYFCVPLGIALTVALIHELFPQIIPAIFRKIIYMISCLFCICFLFLDTFSMSQLMIFCQLFGGLVVLFLMIRFAWKLRKTDFNQKIFLFGVVVLFYAGIRDFLFYNGKQVLPPFDSVELSQVALLGFSLLAAVAIAKTTVERVQKIQHQKQQLTLENEALDRINRLKSEMMATISHETRTPLAVLASYSGLVAMELREKGVEEQMASDLDKIAYEAKRVAEMMDGMKDFANAKHEPHKISLLNLEDLVQQTANLYRPILERNGIALKIALSPLPQTYGNPEELTQVFFNILQNAKNHTEKGSVVIIGYYSEGLIQLIFKDTGEGILPTLLPFVFEKGVSSTKGGSGLGLSISQKIIQKYHGDITIESQVDIGTKVMITLPVVKEDES